MHEEPPFKTAKGRLTPYALACGYIERRALEGFADADVTLWYEGGPVFQVRAHDRETGTRLFWETTDTLGEARKIYDRAERIAAFWEAAAKAIATKRDRP